MSTGDVIETALIAAGNTDGVPIVNTWHFAMTPGSSPPDMASFAANFIAVWQGPLLAVLTTEWQPIQCNHTVIAGPSVGAQFIDTSWAGTSGSLGGPTAPYTQCLLIVRKGPNARRDNRGRLFLSCVERAVFNDAGNVLTFPAAIATVITAVTQNCVDGLGNLFVPSLFNRKTRLFTAITVGGAGERAGSRRKRRYRV